MQIMTHDEISSEMRSAIGLPVHNPDGDAVGEIEDVILRDDQAYAILDLSNSQGTNGTLYSVPWESLDTSHEDGPRMSIEIDDEILHEAEELAVQDRQDYDDEAWNQAIFVYHPQVHWPS